MAVPDDLPAALSHVRWIGGGSGAAKSTVARTLADAKGAVVYDTDAVMRDHADRCPRDQCPKLASFIGMTMDERWVCRTPQQMLEMFHWFAGEGFDLIVEDLLALPRDRLVIAEGFRLLPRLVAPLLADTRHALWLLPTPAFRRRAFDARGTTWDIPQRTSNPDIALTNILARDALFTDRLRGEAAALGLYILQVDGALSEDALLARIGDLLFR
ncbi:MAG: hypothetical protein AAFZ99_03660 [Pseudomonadota bacterium]